MKIILPIFLSFCVFFVGSCKSPGITGHWERLNFDNERKMIPNAPSNFGNLDITSDSLFFFHGDGMDNMDTTPGWHVGGDFKGNWSIKNKTLTVQYDKEYNPFGMQFEIILLTKQKLILSLRSDTTHKMEFRRLP